MSSLSTTERQILEKLFQMGSGYVLNFSDRTFEEFFRNELSVEIYDQRYNYASGSKANRMRGFWNDSDDDIAGKSIERVLQYIDTQLLLERFNKNDFPDHLIERARTIVARLLNRAVQPSVTAEREFMDRNFGQLSIERLRLDPAINDIVQQRIDEIRKCLGANAPLATIFLCGSTLEGILLGIACGRPRDFNQARSSPKGDSGVKRFHEWKLNDFIEVSRELDLVDEDVKKFSHALRDFRNYMHPYEQMSSRFNPTNDTAKICWQVLQAAITQLSR